MKRGELKVQYVSNLDGAHVPFSEYPRRLAHGGALRADWLLKRGKKVIARIPCARGQS